MSCLQAPSSRIPRKILFGSYVAPTKETNMVLQTPYVSGMEANRRHEDKTRIISV